ncbi:MAG: hypothetical protein ACJ74W_21915 [Pyrinomonadaceae bacterium]
MRYERWGQTDRAARARRRKEADKRARALEEALNRAEFRVLLSEQVEDLFIS